MRLGRPSWAAAKKAGTLELAVWVQTPELPFSGSELSGMLLTFLGLSFLIGELVSLPPRAF